MESMDFGQGFFGEVTFEQRPNKVKESHVKI
jgi:hypothetical protein